MQSSKFEERQHTQHEIQKESFSLGWQGPVKSSMYVCVMNEV